MLDAFQEFYINKSAKQTLFLNWIMVDPIL